MEAREIANIQKTMAEGEQVDRPLPPVDWPHPARIIDVEKAFEGDADPTYAVYTDGRVWALLVSPVWRRWICSLSIAGVACLALLDLQFEHCWCSLFGVVGSAVWALLNYWLRKGFPFVEPRFFFGNIRDVVLMRKTIGQAYQEIYEKLGSKPLGGFFKLRQPILMVKHPDLIRTVLVDEFESFQSNDIHVRRDANPLLKLNPLLASGATWRSMKSVWTPHWDKALGSQSPTVKNVSQNMVNFLKSTSSEYVESKELSRKFVSDVIASWAIGVELDSFQNPNMTFRIMSDRIIRRTFRTNIALLLALYAPNLSNYFHFRRVQDQATKDDFLQYLIDINKESEQIGEGTVFNYDRIMGHSVNLFLNGVVMMSDPFCWCLYEIGRDWRVQSLLRDELKAFGVAKLEDLTQEKLSELKYLDMVLKECCRLHPPIQSITRVCNKETVLEFGGIKYSVDVGTPVNVPVYALHMDPEHFPEPERFRPERFAPEAPAHKQFVYLPYSYGPRACPGEKFSKMILKTGISAILIGYEIVPHESLKTVEQDPMSSLVNAAKGDILLSFRPIVS
ncbi:hypothetical protein GE061_006429 [Apolygus lucorum]|uniref:Cytochrome P450 n=1 Tax=Apolygus lucorum TaxID=248454 RepID=A0A8S9WVK0_APOLU|nr:hypothetical protein GE061_006429 [Apolygus lucorum]